MKEKVLIRRFEDLMVWQKARELTRTIYQLTATEKFYKDYGLKDQIQRAAVSIMSNIAEGFERASRAEFHHFLLIAKGSCAEVRSQLYIALDVGYINHQQFETTKAQAEEVGRLIGGLRASLKRNQ